LAGLFSLERYDEAAESDQKALDRNPPAKLAEDIRRNLERSKEPMAKQQASAQWAEEWLESIGPPHLAGLLVAGVYDARRRRRYFGL